MPSKEIYWKYRDQIRSYARRKYAEGGAKEREKNRLRCLRYRSENRKSYNRTCKQYRKANIQLVRLWDRNRYQRDKKKRQALNHSTYKKHRKERNAHTHIYYIKNKKKLRKAQCLYNASPKGKRIIFETQQRYRTRKRNALGSFSEKEWTNLCHHYGDKCARCRKRRKLTADHIVPLSKKGTSFIKNIQPLCRSCNSWKNSKTIYFPPPQPSTSTFW